MSVQRRPEKRLLNWPSKRVSARLFLIAAVFFIMGGSRPWPQARALAGLNSKYQLCLVKCPENHAHLAAAAAKNASSTIKWLIFLVWRAWWRAVAVLNSERLS